MTWSPYGTLGLLSSFHLAQSLEILVLSLECKLQARTVLLIFVSTVLAQYLLGAQND